MSGWVGGLRVSESEKKSLPPCREALILYQADRIDRAEFHRRLDEISGKIQIDARMALQKKEVTDEKEL